MRALITGSTGFVGTYLTDLLEDQDIEVYGYELHNGQDLRNYEQLRNTLDEIRPDYIYHLAAQAFVPESFTSPQRAFEVNTIGSLNLLEAVRNLGIKTKILLAGTSEEYGDGEVSEDSMLEPASPYAIAKAAMDQLGQLYTKSYGMNIVVTRAFNHTGAGRGEMYAESSFAKQIVEIERGKRKQFMHGNLESVRNYTDVRDIVRAYKLCIDLPSGVYNICSDQNVTMKQVVDSLEHIAGIELDRKTNPALYRPYDFSFKEPNCDKFKALTDWKPENDLQKTLHDILEYWRAK